MDKIGANISACPRHCKLMFLTKEAIWKEDLGINETDPEFLKIVHQLADSFTKNGIEDKSSFLDKVEEYAEIFFKLYVEDQKNPQQSSQQGSQQQNGQQGSQQQSGQWGVGRPKDGDEHGNAFVLRILIKSKKQ